MNEMQKYKRKVEKLNGLKELKKLNGLKDYVIFYTFTLSN